MTFALPERDHAHYPYVHLIGDKLYVYRANLEAGAHPQCTARLPADDRCENLVADWLMYCGQVNVAIGGTDGYVCALQSAFGDTAVIRQRCLEHLGSGIPDAVPVELTPFDPDRDSDAILYPGPRWQDGRVLVDPALSNGSGRSTHAGNCPFGDHLEWWAPTQEETKHDVFSGEGYGAEQIASYNAFGRQRRTEWLPKVREAAPDLYRMLLEPNRVPYFVDEDGEPCFWYDDEPADAEVLPTASPETGRMMLSTGSELASDLTLHVPAQANVAADPTALYRYFDEDDVLLYIGISGTLSTRINGHARGSSWMDFAARSTIERHPTRSAAEAAERTAIKAERPLFNSQYNNTPEAQKRLVEYLISKSRPDLLAPAISRG